MESKVIIAGDKCSPLPPNALFPKNVKTGYHSNWTSLDFEPHGSEVPNPEDYYQETQISEIMPVEDHELHPHSVQLFFCKRLWLRMP
jgi:hypothetical protein